MMEICDVLAEEGVLNSGRYKSVSDALVEIHESLEQTYSDGASEFAAEAAAANPELVRLELWQRGFQAEPLLVRAIISCKARELASKEDRVEAKREADAFKAQLVHNLIKSAAGAVKGTFLCFRAHANLLDYVVERLDELSIHPQAFLGRDEQSLPTRLCGVAPILEHEPRFLRWLLELPKNANWPMHHRRCKKRKFEWVLDPSGETRNTATINGIDADALEDCDKQEVFRDLLLEFANEFGGDNDSTNAPCECENCQCVALP